MEWNGMSNTAEWWGKVCRRWWGATGSRMTNKRLDMWDGRDQWYKLQGMTKVELVGTLTQEKACEWQLFFSSGVDTRKLKGETKIKDYLEKDYWEKEKQGWEELGSSQSGGIGTESVGQKAWWPYAPTGTTRSDDEDETEGCRNTYEKSSVNCFAPCSEDSNDLIVSVALATFLTQSCPVVPRDAVTTSMYLVKSSLAKTGALEATAPVRKD